MSGIEKITQAASTASCSRRSFLGMLGISLGTIGVAAATTQSASAETGEEYPSRPNAKAILYNGSKCIDCHYCEAGCKNANGLSDDVKVDVAALAGTVYPKEVLPYKMVRDSEKRPKIVDDDRDAGRWLRVQAQYQESDDNAFVRRSCTHCGLCADVCPSGAIKKRSDGIVDVNPDRCIGCFYCYQACPYNTPKYVQEGSDKTMRKCNMCASRIDEGKIPACVEACPAGALEFGPFDEMVKKGVAAVKELQDSGNKDANLYGAKEHGGIGVISVLTKKPKEFKLPNLK